MYSVPALPVSSMTVLTAFDNAPVVVLIGKTEMLGLVLPTWSTSSHLPVESTAMAAALTDAVAPLPLRVSPPVLPTR